MKAIFNGNFQKPFIIRFLRLWRTFLARDQIFSEISVYFLGKYLEAFTERNILVALNSFARCQDRCSSRKNHKTNRLYNPVLEILNARWIFYCPEFIYECVRESLTEWRKHSKIGPIIRYSIISFLSNEFE